MLSVPRGLRSSAHLASAAALLGTSLALGACLFPEYTFDETSGGAGGSKSTTASTTSIASTTTATTDAASSSTGPPMEDCFNGADDDGDQLADCEDPDCEADTECVDPIPVGWGAFGYVVLGEQGTTAPACPAYASSVKYTGNKDLANTGFSCSNCTCGTPMNRQCELDTDLDSGTAGLQLFQLRNVPCNNANATNIRTLTVPDPWDLSCDATNSSTGGQMSAGQPCNTSVFTQSPIVTGGSCTPGGGVINKTSPTWQTASNACGGIPALAGCDADQKCMPRSKSPYFAGICIGKAGDQACPAPFNQKHVYYKSFLDDRSCAACGCQSPSGGLCTVELTLSTDAACGTDVVTFNAGTCQDLAGNPTISGSAGVVTQAPTGGSCPPTSVTSAKLGDVIPSAASATTFCCL